MAMSNPTMKLSVDTAPLKAALDQIKDVSLADLHLPALGKRLQAIDSYVEVAQVSHNTMIGASWINFEVRPSGALIDLLTWLHKQDSADSSQPFEAHPTEPEEGHSTASESALKTEFPSSVGSM